MQHSIARAKDPKIQGTSLELLLAKVLWNMGLQNITLRDKMTIQGIELDLTAERFEPNYTRYLVQCKHQKNPVGPPVLMKELGNATVENFDVIFIVSFSSFTPNMRSTAIEGIRRTGKTINLFTQNDLSSEEEFHSALTRENDFVASIKSGNDRELVSFILRRMTAETGVALNTTDPQKAFHFLIDRGFIRTQIDYETFKSVFELTLKQGTGRR